MACHQIPAPLNLITLKSTSLSLMLKSAEAAAKQMGQTAHHFRVLQLPMNLFEAGALHDAEYTGKDDSETVLSLAREKEIAVLVNRPLNAIPGKGGGMIRLADPQAEISNTNFEAQQPKVAALENDYKQVLGAKHTTARQRPISFGLLQLGRRTYTHPESPFKT